MTHPVPDSAFHKSSYSQPTGGNCVEVAELPSGAAVRDSKHPQFGHLLFPGDEWCAFLAELKGERF